MFASLMRLFDRSRRRPAAQWNKQHRVVPSLEALEERWVPSTTDSTLSLQALLGSGVNNLSTTSAVTPANTMSPIDTVAPQAQQATASFTPFKTGGSQSQSIAQFNPSMGTLNSVQVVLSGVLTSDVKVENLDAAPSTVNAQVNGNLSLHGPGGTLLSVAPTIADNSTSLTAYDGTLDYGGTSGHDFGQQSASAQKSITLTSNLSAWEGTGSVSLTETAQSSSTVSGSGNEQVNIMSAGSGTATVIYNYTPKPQSPPPAPPPSPPPPPPPSPPPSGSCAPPAGPGTIEGIVYLDPSKTGHYAQSDTGVNHVTVTLTGTTLTGQQVQETATTGSNGYYIFTGLQSGVYALSDLPIPSTYTAGASNLGSLGGVVSNGEMILALPQGGDAMCYDFGLVPTPSPTPSSPPPVQSPPPAAPPPSPSPSPAPSAAPTSPAPSDPAPILSKRSLIGDGWQSLG
jgi:hypothetical protein